MEMGCGKSLTGIAISGILYQFGEVDRVLVVAPLSILGVWEEEYEKFAAFPYELVVLRGSSIKKREQIQQMQEKQGVMQVVVVNYESAWRLEKELLEYAPDLIIADEGHKLKENRMRFSTITCFSRFHFCDAKISLATQISLNEVQFH
jgi:SNF2 family DNA or RNA helicase